MHPVLKFVRTTMIGGVIFLAPLLLAAFLLGKGYHYVNELADALVARLPWLDQYRLPGQAAIALVVLLGAAFAAGLFAQTRLGQGLFRWVEDSILGALPRFSFMRGLTDSLGKDERSVTVVLVPADAGLALGFMFEDAVGGRYPVFLPGAPDWQSGSMVFARSDDVTTLDMGFLEATWLLRRLGANQARVLARLAAASPA